jgi:hypothetical protein
MDIPSYTERGEADSIPNLHPSQRSPSHYTNTNTNTNTAATEDNVTTTILGTPTSTSSFSDRIGSFVGSCSRTSLMYMAENVTVSNPTGNYKLVRSLTSYDNDYSSSFLEV